MNRILPAAVLGIGLSFFLYDKFHKPTPVVDTRLCEVTPYKLTAEETKQCEKYNRCAEKGECNGVGDLHGFMVEVQP